MPTRAELIATGRSDEDIAREICADALVYQDLEALKQSVTTIRADLMVFDASCFDGCYITGDIDEHYLDAVEGNRGGKANKGNDDDGDGQARSNSCCNWPRGAGLMAESGNGRPAYHPKRWPSAPARSAASSASIPRRCT